jgi:hypothetical protein
VNLHAHYRSPFNLRCVASVQKQKQKQKDLIAKERQEERRRTPSEDGLLRCSRNASA